MSYRVDIYIGSDNGTGKIGKKYLERIRDWACSVFPEGYTLVKGTGYYQNSSEESVIVNVLSERARLYNSLSFRQATS
jgi:hypothetical protein